MAVRAGRRGQKTGRQDSGPAVPGVGGRWRRQVQEVEGEHWGARVPLSAGSRRRGQGNENAFEEEPGSSGQEGQPGLGGGATSLEVAPPWAPYLRGGQVRSGGTWEQGPRKLGAEGCQEQAWGRGLECW